MCIFTYIVYSVVSVHIPVHEAPFLRAKLLGN